MSTVLVVEDDFAQRQILHKLLRSIGLNVIFACDGVEALSLAERHCPNLVILDIVIPRMNGYEVCRKLKSLQNSYKPTVLMYSNKSEEWDYYWGCKQGADAYVSKFSRPQELIDTVKYLLQKEM
jgi:twitching motility two-component system response regulator PilH